jgi:hypothetical protein
MKVSITRCVKTSALAACAVVVAAAPSAASARPFLDRFNNITNIASTVPASGLAAGDQNPYGVAVVPRTVGDLRRGEVLVSNFNNIGNFQGTGSSIVEISRKGKVHVFAVVPEPDPTIQAVGLTTALVALRSGYVVVGNLPAPGGMLPTSSPVGALTVLDSHGNVVRTITAKDINGPWDMTALDFGHVVVLFVTNVMNGTVAGGGSVVNDGTVVRITLLIDHGVHVISNQVIADGFPEETSTSALVVGPTGVGLGDNDVLYVADSINNRIAAIPQALTRTTVKHNGGDAVISFGPNAVNPTINDPLGLAIAPNDDIVTVNGNDGNAVETTPWGTIVAVKTLIPNGGGDLFGIAIKPFDRGLYFVNDATPPSTPANSLELLH